jgi:5-methylcytosine-specific restriction endonuclease McrA
MFDNVDRKSIRRLHSKDVDADVILHIFEYRCLRCRKPSTTVHEIVPKSHGRFDAMKPSNRVPLCDDCHHNWAHVSTSESIPELLSLRITYLDARGICD